MLFIYSRDHNEERICAFQMFISVVPAAFRLSLRLFETG